MKILYSLVGRAGTVLAEHTDDKIGGNFQVVTRMLLGKIDNGKDGRVSYLYDQHMVRVPCIPWCIV